MSLQDCRVHPVRCESLLEDLLRFSHDEGQTTLFSTHITSDLERVASHVAILRDGELTYFGGLDELKDNVKRLHIQSPRPLPADLAIADAIETRIKGAAAIVSVAKVDQAAIETLRENYDASVTIENLNLEDILLELNDA